MFASRNLTGQENMDEFICEGKYIFSREHKDTIAVSVLVSDLPKTMEINGEVLNLKTSFHTSLVCIGKIIEKNRIEIPDFVEKVLADFCEFGKDNPIEFKNFREEFYFSAKEAKKTIVVMCDILNLNKFFDFINEKYNLGIEYPPTHVTLYTLQPDAGIFIVDSEDLKNLAKPIANPGIKLKWEN